MRLSISIAAAAAAFFAAAAHAFVVVPSGAASSARRSSARFMSSVTEPETIATATDADGANVDVAAGDRQKMYGDDLDLPQTYVMCGRCKTAYALQADDLGNRGKGRYVSCRFSRR